MDKKQKALLICDSIVNLLLGILLLLFPSGVIEVLGLPTTSTFFYTSILGGVLFGIGIALGIEFLFYEETRGLGISGAIAINLCGSFVLFYWLLFAKPEIPQRGIILLWIVALLVFGIGIIEVISFSWHPDKGKNL
jgi:hypothetical protein